MVVDTQACFSFWDEAWVMVHWYEGSLVEKSRKGNIFYDVGAFCFVKAEFKLRRRVRHLRIDSEKAVLIKRRGYCEQRTDTVRRKTHAAKISWCRPILCPQDELELRSDLYDVWTEIPSRSAQSPPHFQTCDPSYQWPFGTVTRNRSMCILLKDGRIMARLELGDVRLFVYVHRTKWRNLWPMA